MTIHIKTKFISDSVPVGCVFRAYKNRPEYYRAILLHSDGGRQTLLQRRERIIDCQYRICNPIDYFLSAHLVKKPEPQAIVLPLLREAGKVRRLKKVSESSENHNTETECPRAPQNQPVKRPPASKQDIARLTENHKAG